MNQGTLIREIGIGRDDVEKFIVVVQQIFLPIDLNKKSRIVIDYDPGLPSVKVKFLEVE